MATEDKWDNKGQYTEKRIMLYEQIFGKGYISAGGHRMTEQMCLHALSQATPLSRRPKNCSLSGDILCLFH